MMYLYLHIFLVLYYYILYVVRELQDVRQQYDDIRYEFHCSVIRRVKSPRSIKPFATADVL